MIHDHSMQAEPAPEKKFKMYHAIYAAYDAYQRPLTDRDILTLMFGKDERDMNKVRPRITEMIAQNFLKECGKATDFLTHKTVRLVRIKRSEENTQAELF